jgi:hypothetical protein
VRPARLVDKCWHVVRDQKVKGSNPFAPAIIFSHLFGRLRAKGCLVTPLQPGEVNNSQIEDRKDQHRDRMRKAEAINLINTEPAKNEDRKRIGPQRIHPQRNNENHFCEAVRKKIDRRETPMGVPQRFRRVQRVKRSQQLRAMPELVFRENADNRIERRWMNEPEPQASDGFQRAINSFERYAHPKSILNNSAALL